MSKEIENVKETVREDLTDEQKSVVDFDGGELLVSASAGSGKTTVMIRRIVELIKSGKAELKEILAITFTDAAASDMKKKLNKKLSDEISGLEDCAAKERLSKALKQLPTADISTIDSFCSNTVRIYFYKCEDLENVSPDYNICDEGQKTIFINNALDDVLTEYIKKEDADFIELRDLYGKNISLNNLKKILKDIKTFLDTEADDKKLMDLSLNAFSIEKNQEYKNFIFSNYDKKIDDFIKCRIDTFKDKLIEKFPDLTDEEYEKDVVPVLDNFLKVLELIKKGRTEEELNFETVRISSRIKSEDLKNEVEELKKEFKKIKEIRSDKLYLLKQLKAEESAFYSRKKAIGKIFEIYEKFESKFAELKRDNNVLDFVDLEKFAIKILSDGEVIEEIREKYKYVFVDEYQDTNGVQEELLKIITDDNLFMVGDVKQSIYAFRGCNPQFFVEKAEKLSKADNEKYKKLNSNFRSAKKVVQAVNGVFGYCMTEDLYGGNYNGESDLIYKARYPEDYEGVAEYRIYEDKGKEETEEGELFYDINLKENYERAADDKINGGAFVVADIIKELYDKQEYYDLGEKKKEKRHKKIKYSDITILSRGIKGQDGVSESISSLVNVLEENGIPVSCEIEEDIKKYPEIKTLICCLELIDNFNQDIPLSTVLKSPIVNLTDKELLRIAKRNGEGKGKYKYFYERYNNFKDNGEKEIVDKIKNFEMYFNELRSYADYHTCRDVLYKIITDNGFYIDAYVTGRGVTGERRIKALLDVCCSGGKNHTVKSFLEYLEDNEDALVVPLTSSGDAVKIMTIHKSKGLEFPVVILYGVSNEFKKGESSGKVYFNRNCGMAFGHFDKENGTENKSVFQKYVALLNKENDLKEKMRFLYVAMTRAKSHLYLVGEGEFLKNSAKVYDPKSFDGFLPPDFIKYCKVTDSGNSTEFRVKGERKTLTFSKNEPDGNGIEKLDKLLNFDYKYKNEIDLPLKTSVTAAVGDLKNKETVQSWSEEDEVGTDKDKGITAHKILELYDFTNMPDLKEFVDEKIKDGILLKEKVEDVNLDKIQSALNNSVFKNLKCENLYREKSFIANIPASELYDDMKGVDTEILVQGVIDLLAIDGENAHVIDYKYSKKGKDKLIETYSKQLRLYAYAVKSALKVSTVKTTIVNLVSGEVVEIDE